MKRIAILLASSAFALPAGAADIIYNEPMAVSPMDPVAFAPLGAPQWTGFYVGGQIGAAFNTDSGPFTSAGSSFAGGSDGSDAGLVGGVHVGYDHQIDNIILGAIADIDLINASSSSSFGLTNAQGGIDTFGSASDIDYVGTVRGKLGVAADRIAVYATGGLAYASLDTSTFAPAGGFTGAPVAGAPVMNYGVVFSQDTDEVGYAVGAGVDYLASNNLSFGVEYLYHDLGSADTNVTFAGTGPGARNFTASSNTDLDFHTVKAKASFRFN